jgi:hypothetical protein
MRLFVVLFGIGIGLIVTGTAFTALAVPRWALPIVLVFAFLSFLLLPVLIIKILDPLNSKAIRTYVESLGATEIDIRSYPNHYGVRFVVNGQGYYAKCLVMKRGTFKWKGKSPEQMLGAHRAA